MIALRCAALRSASFQNGDDEGVAKAQVGSVDGIVEVDPNIDLARREPAKIVGARQCVFHVAGTGTTFPAIEGGAGLERPCGPAEDLDPVAIAEELGHIQGKAGEVVLAVVVAVGDQTGVGENDQCTGIGPEVSFTPPGGGGELKRGYDAHVSILG